MAHFRNLDKTFDDVKDMETSQNKKQTSNNASLTIVEKNKNKSNTPKKNGHLWLGFKVMNVLNISKGFDEVANRSESEHVKFGMSDKEALKCQNCVSSYLHVPQKMWPSVNDLRVHNHHYTQIPSDIDVCEGFAMYYHIALFFQLEEMLIRKEEALEKITQRFEDMHILLGNEISDPVAIMCTHDGKQWSGHTKVYLKNVQ